MAFDVTLRDPGGGFNVSLSSVVAKETDATLAISATAAAVTDTMITSVISAELAVTAAVDEASNVYRYGPPVTARGFVPAHTVSAAKSISGELSVTTTTTSSSARSVDSSASMGVTAVALSSSARVVSIDAALTVTASTADTVTSVKSISSSFSAQLTSTTATARVHNTTATLAITVSVAGALSRSADVSASLPITVTLVATNDGTTLAAAALSETISSTATLAKVVDIAGSLAFTTSTATTHTRSSDVASALGVIESTSSTTEVVTSGGISGALAVTVSVDEGSDTYRYGPPVVARGFVPTHDVTGSASAAVAQSSSVTAQGMVEIPTISGTTTVDVPEPFAYARVLEHAVTGSEGVDTASTLTVTAATLVGISRAAATAAFSGVTASTDGELTRTLNVSGQMAVTVSTLTDVVQSGPDLTAERATEITITSSLTRVVDTWAECI